MKRLLPTILLPLFLLACGPAADKGSQVTEKHLSVGNFTKVRSELPVDVTVNQLTDASFDVVADLDEDQQSLLQASVENDTLVLKAASGFKPRDLSKTSVKVGMPVFLGATVVSSGQVKVLPFDKFSDPELVVQGSGALTYNGLFNNLTLTSSGSGAAQVTAGLMSSHATVLSSGTGSVALSGNLGGISAGSTGAAKVTLSGFATTADLTTAGAGSIDAAELQARSGSVTNAGSGLLTGRFDGSSVDVTLQGSGDIALSGTSTLHLLDMSGSGKLLH